MRQLRGNTQKLFYVYVVAMGLFHLYTAIFGNYEAYLQRSIHLTWVLPMCFVLYPISSRASKEYVPLYDWILAFISTLPGIYNMINYTHIIERIAQVDPLTTTQLVLGTLLLVILIEATRRVVGVPLAIIATFFAGYMYFGHHMPGIMKGLSFTFEEVIEHIYLTGEGIFSVPLGVSAAFVMIFLIFGGFLEKSGVGEYFMHFAEAFTGTQAGGPAKIAVVSSALFGSISGSAVANVYGTGTFTIPLMKRIGYPAHFAGAVEAVASAGGQIMPPIMGAGAFIMASFLGRPYSEIMIAATIPAILYYGAVIFMVHLGALKNGLKGLEPDELPSKKEVLKKLYFILPIIGLVYMLLDGYTPMWAATIGIVLTWGISMLNPGKRMTPVDAIDAIYSGAKNIPMVCIACAAAGIVVGSVGLTGFGFKFVGFIFAFAKDIPFVALLLVMFVSLILGMGLPTTGAYILAAALGVPALAKLGFPTLSSHLFVFYFAIVSNITPPVALAAYAASSIAGSPPNKTGFTAMRLGILAFIVPFAFCYDTGLILNDGLLNNLTAVAGGIGAIFAMGYAMIGFTRRPLALWQRAFFCVAGVLCLSPLEISKAAGVGLLLLGFFLWRNPKPEHRIA